MHSLLAISKRRLPLSWAAFAFVTIVFRGVSCPHGAMDMAILRLDIAFELATPVKQIDRESLPARTLVCLAPCWSNPHHLPHVTPRQPQRHTHSDLSPPVNLFLSIATAYSITS